MRVRDVGPVAALTGEGSPNRTASRAAVHATDLGICWDDGAGGVLVAFGDSYGAGWGGHGAGPEHADWRCNLLARSTSRELSAGLLLDEWISDTPGHAAQIIARERREHTVIPTAGIAAHGRQYLGYMSVTRWHGPGRWQTGHAGVAVSADGGRSWTRGRHSRWPNTRRGDHPFQVVAFAPDTTDGTDRVLVYGTPNGRFGEVRLARADTRRLAEPAAWEFFDGVGWVPRMGDAAAVVAGPAGELSVGWHAGLRRWLMLHLDEHRAAIVLRSAPAPTGPWTDGTTVVSARDYPAPYGGYLHPWSLTGDELFFTLSQWGPYNVTLMRARLAQDQTAQE